MIEVYTDGGCRHNPGLGAWAYIIVKDNQILYHQATVHASSAGVPIPTTNNHMELTAILRSLEYLEQQSVLELLDSLQPITIYSDSQYAIKTITEWAPKWKAANTLHDHKNSELIENILSIYDKVRNRVDFEWVKAHSTDRYNNLADRLVNLAMDEALALRAPSPPTP